MTSLSAAAFALTGATFATTPKPVCERPSALSRRDTVLFNDTPRLQPELRHAVSERGPVAGGDPLRGSTTSLPDRPKGWRQQWVRAWPETFRVAKSSGRLPERLQEPRHPDLR